MTLKESRDRARRRLIEEVVDEMTSWSPSERVRTFKSWLRGSLSLIHLHVLTILEAEGPLPMGRLAESLDVSVASATGIIDRMEDRGLVERRPSQADRRVVEVHQTGAGAAIFENLRAERRVHLTALFETLSARELAGLLAGLRALRRARQAHAEAMSTETEAEGAARARTAGAGA